MLRLNHFVPLIFKNEQSKLPGVEGKVGEREQQEMLTAENEDDIQYLGEFSGEGNDPGKISVKKLNLMYNAGKNDAGEDKKKEIQPYSELEKEGSFPIEKEEKCKHAMADDLKMHQQQSCIHEGQDFNHPTWKSLNLRYLAREMMNHQVLEKIPRGDKSFARFVYKSEYNQNIGIKGATANVRHDYTDDTGASCKVSPICQAYHIDSTGLMAPFGRNMSFSQGLWYHKKKDRDPRTLMNPQPQKENSIQLRVIYHWKDEPFRYRRRTIEVFQAPEQFKDLVGLAYVEYQGKCMLL